MQDPNYIRNFCIIAHIDHGKSTLADRMLELTGTVEKRKMRDQVLDDMELEREKGITIKMRPVRMNYKSRLSNSEYVLNLIDTPGHIDFSYEVSRALKAVEGCILLVDATQGIQAQTLTVLAMAKKSDLVIVPALSKVDSPYARIEEVVGEVSALLSCAPESIIMTSGKTGEGVETLLDALVQNVQPPAVNRDSGSGFRALVFDFQYSNHKGVIVFVRDMDGSVKKGDELKFCSSGEKFFALDVGIFVPEEQSTGSLSVGSIGYIVTGIKRPGIASVGDTITLAKSPLSALHGYEEPLPVVWASIYPEDADDFDELKHALSRLKLTDSAFTFEEESSGSLGRGFRCGFLGLLHLEIITERLRREFNLQMIIATPSITYEVSMKNGKIVMVYSPSLFPDEGMVDNVREPWVLAKIITPNDYSGAVFQMLYDHEGELKDTEVFRDGRVCLSVSMPLRELMRNFFDELKSVSSGYASLSYEFEDLRKADVTRMDVLVADAPVEAFTKVIAKRRIEEECERAVDKLFAVLPRQQFATKIQAKASGRIVASRSLSALRKDVTGYLYGGDVTRKKKLLEKQKKGKKKMKERGTVNIPHDVFLKMMKG